MQRHQQPLEVECPLRARQSAHHPDTEGCEERVRGIEAGGRVVVAANDDDIELGQLAAGAGDEVVPGRLGLGAGIGGVEDVTRDEERVDALGLEGVEEPAQEGGMLGLPRDVIERMPQVPIRRVQQTHPVPPLLGRARSLQHSSSRSKRRERARLHDRSDIRRSTNDSESFRKSPSLAGGARRSHMRGWAARQACGVNPQG